MQIEYSKSLADKIKYKSNNTSPVWYLFYPPWSVMSDGVTLWYHHVSFIEYASYHSELGTTIFLFKASIFHVIAACLIIFMSEKLNCKLWVFLQSCRHESWVNTLKHLIDDVPIFLRSEGLNNIPDALSLIFKSVLANAGDFIKWVAEVGRREEDGSGLSKEEKGRLSIKVG